MIYKDLGEFTKAVEYTQKSLELQPNHPESYKCLGNIYRDLGSLEKALEFTLKSLEINPDNPDIYINLGGIYKDLGQLEKALESTQKSLEIKAVNPDAYQNLGCRYQDLGEHEKAIESSLKSLDLNPANLSSCLNLSSAYKELGNLDQALSWTLKSLEIQPDNSRGLCMLGQIKSSQGHNEDAKKFLHDAIKKNTKEFSAYYSLSLMISTPNEAINLLQKANSIKTTSLTPQNKSILQFTLSNCYHKTKDYENASKCLKLANDSKLIISPSNALEIRKLIFENIDHKSVTKLNQITNNTGKKRVFIVGMPRCGSTLLETILSMNPKIKDLGESRSLQKSIMHILKQTRDNPNNLYLGELYSELEPIDDEEITYTIDKQLYNFIYIDWIANHMPHAKIIHCWRNPMDHILSMYRSNLAAGNNFTSSIADSAKVLIAQEQVMQLYKKRYPEKIFSFSYDQFVKAPEENLAKLLKWLELSFDRNYLHPEKSTRCIVTESVMQARRPISNKSVGGWKNYAVLLQEAKIIFKNEGILID